MKQIWFADDAIAGGTLDHHGCPANRCALDHDLALTEGQMCDCVN